MGPYASEVDRGKSREPTLKNFTSLTPYNIATNGVIAI